MQIQNLITQKYKRFFAFGCSFTHYPWPTWADIIGREIPYYENWGKGGGGNQFIFNSVVECNLRHKFTKNDLVIVMWSSCSREDRYVDDQWLVAATEYREKVYGKEWMKKFATQGKGLMIRDFATIYATQQLLNSLECDWINLNSLPLVRFDMDRAEADVLNKKATIDDLENRWSIQQKMLCLGSDHRDEYLADKGVVDFYKDIFLSIKEPVFDRILKNKERPNFGDKHPSPQEALDYLNDVLPNNLNAKEFVEEWGKIVRSIKQKDEMPKKFIRQEVQRL
jgi:hypothetical protein|tara:strand:+ start:74 stop:916 length:843 start_codon:yes stop_codon:yes gene_type:complete